MFAPSVELQSLSEHPAHPPAIDFAGRDTILVVEDEERIANLLACILERGPYRVLRASSAAEALHCFDENSQQIALATLDCTLPDLRGEALCRELRRRAGGLPVLFVSGHDASQVRAQAAAEGPTGFMAKPFLPAEVLKQVRGLIGATA
jgi:DNA-binding response OmpR family regulator